ncbi:Gfo/Idh/MocA family oxidoreductase [Pedobacter sp. MC2016-05]|uniref:Gfo/Idh/MocA family oxidoreductase n=1 Tax=Pedobacter sp. MC2016-05 TaxID=2994474 RepID=UPI0022480A13|nr:Gfo/Idh/MocA family oxidoreductase [Pedobacter sp. MC2016-05]MCX2476942.1 Gfo/Idh/MocA family oxidoreductase [Pedobacter sp. MC2016-05]
MENYRIGIIGYGGFGKFLHHWFDKMENTKVVAIAETGQRTHDIPGCKVYYDWKELLGDPNIDIVSIVTPPGLHAEMACEAMKAGKHVLLEKPVAITEETAEEILKVQKETGKIITVNHMIRYNSIMQKVKELGESGAFGELRHVVVNNYAQDEALPIEHWFWDEEMSGGILVEHGVHFFDIVNSLTKQNFQQVFGASHHRNSKQRDRVAAMVVYDDGLMGSYYHAFSGPGMFEQTTIQLAYDLARIEIEGWMPLKGKIHAMVNNKTKAEISELPGWTIQKSESLESSEDMSRPEGWGSVENSNDTATRLFGGIAYPIDEVIRGTFEINQSKGEVYGKCVQSILSDLIQRIENKDHKLKVTIEDGVLALKIALLASG